MKLEKEESGQIALKILNDARDKYPENLYVYHMDVNPSYNYVLTDFDSNNFYKWNQEGRPLMQCITVNPLETIRVSYSWEELVSHSSNSSNSYLGHVDFDIYLYYQSQIPTSGPPTGLPITTSSKWDDTTETISWKNLSSLPQSVCIHFYRYNAPRGINSVRVGWAIAKILDQCY